MSVVASTMLASDLFEHNERDQNRPPASPTPPVALDSAGGPIDMARLKENADTIAPIDIRPVLKEKQQPLIDPRVQTTDVPFLNATRLTVEPEVRLETPPAYFNDASPKSEDDYAAAMESMMTEQKKWVARDIECHSHDYSEESRIPPELQKGVASDERIQEFLNKNPIYDQDKQLWAGFEEGSRLLADGANLRDVVYDIINAILEEWGVTFYGRRKLRRAHDLKLFHETKFSCGHSSPDFVIEARGPSFELPEQGDLGFSNVTTCITIDPPGSESCFKGMFERHAVLARQIFAHQPNRRFVRTCCIDQEGIAWYHFDRSGLYENFGGFYNEEPHNFIRLILGLSSLNEEILGLDTSIRWRLDRESRKATGTVTVVDEGKVSRKFKMVFVEPMFRKSSIYGTGTVVWVVEDFESGEEVLVKDSWRGDGEEWVSECENLKAARGLDGVVQMISCEEDRVQTRDFGVFREDDSDCMNFIQSRMVMERYEHHLFAFSSERQLLCALRDAIAGHRNLVIKAGIIQRDIAWRNILFGKPDAKPGNRGILIDLDLALPIPLIKPVCTAVGHAQFCSIATLFNAISHSRDRRRLPHDYLDDLEAGFYTTSTIMYELDGPGICRNPLPEFVSEWLDCANIGFAENLRFKRNFILSEDPINPKEYIAPFWSEASRNLVEKYYTFIREMAQVKEDIRRDYGSEEAHERLQGLLAGPAIRQNYDYVINLFDIAIMQLDRAKGEKSNCTGQGTKRKAQGATEEDLLALYEANGNRARRLKLESTGEEGV
ncbi:hypothetical protein EST38_g9566 [Candolleomyces aberdarensis]|uniref:Protein kinase domain-containing protein n=1 Tax=Candolleomyces aberdarensis TaxID=2316362 RepID=A0A4Q2DBX6_9AGAR|nr:hypothetical protein EST38_g9566 [Candolleomyces aberdarensis]